MNIHTILTSLLVFLCAQSLISATDLYTPTTRSNSDCQMETSLCLELDYVALKDLYLSTNGDNWSINDEWMTSSEFINNASLPSTQDMSLWHGITVNQLGCVTKIELDTNGLNGFIPTSIGGMSSLEVLDLGHNQLSESIPSELGDLSELQALHLQSNELVGSIPEDLGDLGMLKLLNVSNNQLTGSIPSTLGALLELEFLYLRYNQLAGPIPPQIGNMSQLIILSIHDNQLSGSIPVELGQLSNLQNLMLDDNRLSGEIPYELGDMLSLKNLRLSGNYLTGTLPFSLASLTNLIQLTFNDNDLSGCYFQNLVPLCSQINTSQNTHTSDGNHFCVSWEDFCMNQNGLCGIIDDDPYCYCPTSLNLHENPEPDFNNRASFHIRSDDIIDYDVTSSYKAGDHIDLMQGFEVKTGFEFIAEIDECTEDCEVSVPCEGPPCAELDLEYDSEGNPYFRNQIAIVFPSLTVPISVNLDAIRLYLGSIIYNSALESNPPNSDLSEFQAATTISQCLCGYNIFLFEVDDIYEINEEGGGQVASSDGGPNEEGPSYVVNHLVETGMTGDEAPTQMNIPPPIEYIGLNDITNLANPVVAFLDSGVDPEYIPPSSLLADENGRINLINNFACGTSNTPDLFGWNFVDFNSNIVDNRGHGTSVFLAYLNALNKLTIPVEDQNTLIVKVLDECGFGSAYTSACGINYAVARGANIINTSWGLYANNMLLQTSIDSAVGQGVLVSSSSGNQGKDLAQTAHFPSGYGYPHDKILDLAQQTYSQSTGLDQVFEVGALCRQVGNDNCLVQSEVVNLWSGSNYRTNGSMFTEPGIEIQELFTDTTIYCGIMGTSYAAPQFTACLVDMYIQNSGNEGSTKSELINNSIDWNSNDKGIYYSYLLQNQSCN